MSLGLLGLLVGQGVQGDRYFCSQRRLSRGCKLSKQLCGISSYPMVEIAPDNHDHTEPFQFNLRHMFTFVLLASIYMALNRSTGFLFASLLLGLFVMGAVVVLLRVSNLLLGGFLGAALATGILAVLGLAESPVLGLDFFAACLIYPPIGYAIGMLCAADRMFRSW